MTPPPREALPTRHWQRYALAGAAGLIAIGAVVSVVMANDDPADDTAASPGPSTSGSAPTPTVPTPKPQTGLATPSKNAPTPTSTAPAGSAPKPVRVGIDTTARSGSGVKVAVRSIDSVKGTAEGVGEIAGPAIRITLRVSNDGTNALPLGNVVVNLYYGSKNVPATALSGPGARAFPASVKPGGRADGILVFGVPAEQRDRVKVEFSHTIKAPTVIFTGSAR